MIHVEELRLKFNSGSPTFHMFVLINILYTYISGVILVWFMINFNVLFMCDCELPRDAFR